MIYAETFYLPSALADYMNRNGLTSENVIKIVHNTVSNLYTLIYEK